MIACRFAYNLLAGSDPVAFDWDFAAVAAVVGTAEVCFGVLVYSQKLNVQLGTWTVTVDEFWHPNG